jgi:hypothetical protein
MACRFSAGRRILRNGVSSLTVIAILSLGAVKPGWTAGANSGTPNAAPSTPPPVITSTPLLTTPGSGGCFQQYLPEIAVQANKALAANDTALAFNATGAAAAVAKATADQLVEDGTAGIFGGMAAGLAEAAVGVITPLDAGPAAPGLTAAGLAAGIGAGYRPPMQRPTSPR